VSVIEFDDVSFSYLTQRDGLALDGVSLSVDRGEFVGVAGPSDAGKSTVCRLVQSYIPNFFDGDLSGTVTVDGTDVRETSIGEMSNTVGLLFENPFDQLTGASTTVFEEVAFGLENAGVPREEIIDRVYDAVETTGIRDLVGRNPQRLSGGQSQRLALASILAMEPEVLVLDEPTSQLDPHGTEEIFDVVTEMRGEEFTVVIVSQDTERLAPHLDRLVVLEDGSVRHEGTPESVLTTDGVGELVAVPDAVEVGRRLGLGDADVPLTTAAATAALSGRVAADPDADAGAADTDGGVRHVEGGTGTGDVDVDGDGAGAGDGTGGPAGDPLIDVADVHYAYDGEIEALDGLSLSLDEGCVCVIGQNGAGKSTLMKHLNGLLEPDAGTVRVDGIDTREERVARLARHVGLNFQNPDDQLFHGSVDAEVRYGPRNLGYDDDRIEALAADAIERMGLSEIREANPYDIGLARRKQVAVASVVAMDTPVVVLDEPTAGQDPRGVGLLEDLVESLVDEGKLVVVVTHDMNFVRDTADRVVALRQGRVLLDGTPREVFGDAEELARTDVAPPSATRIGAALGLPETALTVDDLFEAVD
jgi:energy-coupling factor transport system ATP-binding protein